jgi:hypothetical protein
VQIETAELFTIISAISGAVGYGLRHFLPQLFKRAFWSYTSPKTIAAFNTAFKGQDGYISFSQHEILCKDIKTKLANGETLFKDIQKINISMAKELRWIRALAVVQAPDVAIKKADEITGFQSH